MKLGYAIPHEIRIRASANMGFIVKVGCGEFVAINKHVLLDDLAGYLGNPKKWEEDYNKLPGNPQEVATDDRPDPPDRPATVTESIA